MGAHKGLTMWLTLTSPYIGGVDIPEGLYDPIGELKPVRSHKKRRIHKKWLKRYGFRDSFDGHIYFSIDGKIIHECLLP